MSSIVLAIVLACCSIFTILALYIPYYKKENQKKKNKLANENQNKEVLKFSNKVKNQMGSINFGALGIVSKDEIDISMLVEDLLDSEEDKNHQSAVAVNTLKKWKNLIEKHSQYILNYFMHMVLIETDESDNPFWEHYLTDHNKYDNEKCLEIFRKTYTIDFEKELDKYASKENTKDIKELFEKYFKFFNYDKFIKDIKVYISIQQESFSIQMSDKYSSCLCAAYEEFDEDLNGLDWHNF